MNEILDNALLIINKIHPGLLDDGFEIIGSGFGSLVLESNEGVIIRIAKNLDTARQYIKEVKALPYIRHLINVNIPKPSWHMYNPDTVPPGMMAYKKIKGIPIASDKIGIRNRSTIARQVAKFTISFHQIPYEALDCIPERNNGRENLMLLYRDTFNFLRRVLTTPELGKMEKWWQEIFADNSFFVYKPVLCHGDLWYENILVDEEYLNVIGIVDFSDMIIGDPAVDLAPQLYLGEDFYNDVLEEYTKVFSEDEDIVKRAMKHQQLRELRGLQYAIKYNDKDEFTDSIDKIRNRIIFR